MLHCWPWNSVMLWSKTALHFFQNTGATKKLLILLGCLLYCSCTISLLLLVTDILSPSGTCVNNCPPETRNLLLRMAYIFMELLYPSLDGGLGCMYRMVVSYAFLLGYSKMSGWKYIFIFNLVKIWIWQSKLFLKFSFYISYHHFFT